VTIRLDPALLPNPDADIRYVLPDLLAARSDGTVRDDGYDYDDDDVMTIFLDVDDAGAALSLVRSVLRSERVLGNDLSAIARVSIRAKGDIDSVRDGQRWFASVTVEVEETRDASSFECTSAAPESWKEGAVRGARFGVSSAQTHANVVITDVVGRTGDTNASIAALASARAVWEALAREVPPERQQHIESVALESRRPGASELPELD